jgi:hypothetical protein
LPERSRLFRLLRLYQAWAERFLAEPSLINFSDSLGIELIHPRREGRTKGQVGKKGKSNQRWIVGVKFCPLLNGPVGSSIGMRRVPTCMTASSSGCLQSIRTRGR